MTTCPTCVEANRRAAAAEQEVADLRATLDRVARHCHSILDEAEPPDQESFATELPDDE